VIIGNFEPFQNLKGVSTGCGKKFTPVKLLEMIMSYAHLTNVRFKYAVDTVLVGDFGNTSLLFFLEQ